MSTCHDPAPTVIGDWVEVMMDALAKQRCLRWLPVPKCKGLSSVRCLTEPGDTCCAQTIDFGSVTRCHLEPGHKGLHSDGAIMWLDFRSFWKEAAEGEDKSG